MSRLRQTLLCGALLGLFGSQIAAAASPGLQPTLAGTTSDVVPVQFDGPSAPGPYEGGPGFGGPGAGGPGAYAGPGGGGGPDGYGPQAGRRGPGRPGGQAAAYGDTLLGQGGQMLKYHGFALDLSQVAGTPNVSRSIAAVEHQIDIVNRVGLGGGTGKLFRSLPILISNRPFGGGHFKGGHEVEVGGFTAADNRPILLHEYMHAYEFYRMPGGFQNPDIARFYAEAVNNNLYETGSFMLTNPWEYFAVTSSCYLYGTVARAPYNRDAIRKAQPDYYAYLGHLFGRGASGANETPALRQQAVR